MSNLGKKFRKRSSETKFFGEEDVLQEADEYWLVYLSSAVRPAARPHSRQSDKALIELPKLPKIKKKKSWNWNHLAHLEYKNMIFQTFV